MLQSIRTINTKLLCPICYKEVDEYPPQDLKQGKFICLNCKSSIVFIISNEQYVSWLTGQL